MPKLVNSNAPSSATAADAVASSCIANPSATFVPSAPATTGGTVSPTGNNGSGNNGGGNGAVSLIGDAQAIFGLAGAIGVGMVSAVWTLL